MSISAGEAGETARRVMHLIAEIQCIPFEGVGKPEPLKAGPPRRSLLRAGPGLLPQLS